MKLINTVEAINELKSQLEKYYLPIFKWINKKECDNYNETMYARIWI